MTIKIDKDILINIIFQSLDFRSPQCVIESLHSFLKDLRNADKSGIFELPLNYQCIPRTEALLWKLIYNKLGFTYDTGLDAIDAYNYIADGQYICSIAIDPKIPAYSGCIEWGGNIVFCNDAYPTKSVKVYNMRHKTSVVIKASGAISNGKYLAIINSDTIQLYKENLENFITVKNILVGEEIKIYDTVVGPLLQCNKHLYEIRNGVIKEFHNIRNGTADTYIVMRNGIFSYADNMLKFTPFTGESYEIRLNFNPRTDLLKIDHSMTFCGGYGDYIMLRGNDYKLHIIDVVKNEEISEMEHNGEACSKGDIILWEYINMGEYITEVCDIYGNFIKHITVDRYNFIDNTSYPKYTIYSAI